MIKENSLSEQPKNCPNAINNDLYRFAFPDNQGPLGDPGQGGQLNVLIKDILKISKSEKAIIVAHSQGGLATRYYLQRMPGDKPVSRFVTYGTPHNGSDLIKVGQDLNLYSNLILDLMNIVDIYDVYRDTLKTLHDWIRELIDIVGPDIGSESGQDLRPGSPFMESINESYPLPNYISYVFITGEINKLLEHIPLSDALFSILDTDLIVRTDNQKSSFLNPNIKIVNRSPVVHAIGPYKEGADYIGVLKGLEYPVLSIVVHSPVKIVVIDPNGDFVSPDVNTIMGAIYTSLGDVEIPMPLNGEYKVMVIPDPEAKLTDTYSLEMQINGKTTNLAKDISISEIPDEGYIAPVSGMNNVPIVNVGTDQTVRLGSLVTLSGSGSHDSDNGPSPLSFTWSQSAGSNISLSNFAAVKPTFVPKDIGLYTFSLVVNDGNLSSTPAAVNITVPRLGDIDLDGDVDTNDLAKITSTLNKPANGPNDLRDINGDLMLNALDTRKLALLCTRPRCATQ